MSWRAVAAATFLAVCLAAALMTLLVANLVATGWGEGASAYSTLGNIAQLTLVVIASGCIFAAGARILRGRSVGLSFVLLFSSAIAIAAWWVIVVWVVG